MGQILGQNSVASDPVPSKNLPLWVQHQSQIQSAHTAQQLKHCEPRQRNNTWIQHQFCIQSHRHKPQRKKAFISSDPLPKWVRNQFAGLE